MTSDLLDRYLQAVKTFLPRKGEDDILRELSENILSEVDEKEAELGRSLTEGELEEIIKRHGHPILVAARYGPRHYLIGPGLFPYYWLALRIGLIAGLIIRFLVGVSEVLLSPNPGAKMGEAVNSFVGVAFAVFTWTTITFAALEFAGSFASVKYKGNWSPRTLPRVRQSSTVVPRAESVVKIICFSIAVVWWQAFPVAPSLLFGPAATFLRVGPIWTTLHLPILLILVLRIIEGAVDLVFPHKTKLRTRLGLIPEALNTVVLFFVARASNWVVLAPEAHGAAQYAQIVSVVNQVLFYVWIGALIISLAALAVHTYKQFRTPGIAALSPGSQALPRA